MGFFFGGGFEILFFLVFALIIGMFILTAIRSVSQWNKNNHSPRLTVDATVVAKREEVTHHHHHSGNGISHTALIHLVLCHFSGGKRRPDGTWRQRKRIWYVGRRRFRPADLSRHTLSWLPAGKRVERHIAVGFASTG